jgi:hypothetical protein
MRRAHRLLTAAAGVVALLAAASAAHAATVGLADQQPSSYVDPRARELGLRYARLTVPWDAATSQPQAVAAWLAAVRAAGMAPHVAFQHLATDRCPQRPCTTPTAAQYGAAVRRFVALFPQVRTYTTWNEANHASQPVADDPEAVAAYYDELRAACASCTVVAGDVLETGGLVAVRNASGRATFAATESSAATAIDRAFALAAANPRIGRMYVYQWRANSGDRFDAGLVRPDGIARPSYAALARDLAAQRALRWTAAWSTRRAGRLVLRATCTTSARACRGWVTVSIAGRRVAARAYRTSARHPTAVLRVDVPRGWRAARRVALVVRASRPTFPAQTLDLTVTTPTTRR